MSNPSRYNFGEPFTYEFYVRDGNGGLKDLSSVTDAPDVYLFVDLPSRQNASDGTGAFQTINAWASDLSDGGKSIAVTAISDPDIDSAKGRYEYYIAINYVLVDSGQVQTDIRSLPIQRAEVTHAPIDTNEANLESIYADIDSIATSGVQTQKIIQAKIDLREQFESKHYDWSGIWKPDELNNAVAYYALYLIMVDKIRERDDRWAIRAEIYKNTAENIFKGISLEYKEYGAEKPEGEKKTMGNYIRVIR